jgi:hypothetical protein
MTHRTSMDPALDSRTRREQQRKHEKNNPPGTGDLFAPPLDTPASPEEAHARRMADARAKIEAILPEMLRSAGADGISADIVRARAESYGWLTGNEEGRTLSWLSGAIKKAGGVPTDYIASTHPNSNGRTIRRFVHRDAEQRGRAP